MFDEAFVLEYFEKLLERLKSEEIVNREIKISFLKGKATVIIGPRRVGKTYLLFKFVKDNPDSIYFDLEHAAFRDLVYRDFFEIISIFEERFGVKVKYVLLDEIQVIEKWESVVRSLLDSGYYVLITGSSSRLLSREIATQLRGRSLTYFLLPLSFKEYLSFKNFKLRKRLSLKEKVKVMHLLKDYLEWGSYPEVVLSWKEKEKILREYFDAVFQKDFIERFEVVNVRIANLIFEFIFENYSKEISINKIANFVSSHLGKNVKNTVYEYVEKLPDSFVVFFVEKYEKSVYKRKSFSKKVYICDVGLANLLSFESDVGKRMENVVFLELLRRRDKHPFISINYWKSYQKEEVDFVVRKGKEVKELIQVTYSSSRKEIKEREIKSLLKASEELECKNLLVITWNYEGKEEIDGKKIKFVPLWKWLLNFS